jgi:DnaJ-class molecular chaperone
LGTTLNLKTIDGYKTIYVGKGTQHGSQMKLPGMGVPKLQSSQKARGDHYITFNVVIPSQVSNAEAELFRKLAGMEQKINQEEFAKKNSYQRENDQRRQAETMYGEEEGEGGRSAKEMFEQIFGRFKGFSTSK